MELFEPILNQMIYLFILIAIGFILSRFKFIPENSSTVISKLENMIFVPGLVMWTFIDKCTVETISSVWRLIVLAFIIIAILFLVTFFVSKLTYKDNYLRKIVSYGLIFSNFAYMGNAIMLAVFPEIFYEYTVFTLPFWFMIYLIGVPVFLISDGTSEKQSIKQRLKAFLNPMLIAMFIGLILGLTGLGKKLPTSIVSVIKVSGDCMSPLAMILIGITIGRIDVVKMLKSVRLYSVAILRLIVYPLVMIGILLILPKGDFITPTFMKCAVCMIAMPMGLTSIVVPAAYGRDTTVASGLALITHVLSIITIPLIFLLCDAVLF